MGQTRTCYAAKDDLESPILLPPPPEVRGLQAWFEKMLLTALNRQKQRRANEKFRRKNTISLSSGSAHSTHFCLLRMT